MRSSIHKFIIVDHSTKIHVRASQFIHCVLLEARWCWSLSLGAKTYSLDSFNGKHEILRDGRTGVNNFHNFPNVEIRTVVHVFMNLLPRNPPQNPRWFDRFGWWGEMLCWNRLLRPRSVFSACPRGAVTFCCASKKISFSAVTKTSESLLWVFIMSEIEIVLGAKTEGAKYFFSSPE